MYFGNTDHITLRASTLLPHRPDARWDACTWPDGVHISIPVTPGTGDARSDTVDIPWDVVRTLTDADFAVHMAHRAEETARRTGSRLRRMRKARGLTAVELGKRVGMSQPSISRIENGGHDLSLGTLEKPLAAMGYSLSDLASYSDEVDEDSVSRSASA